MTTTIRVSEQLVDNLKKRKLYDRESYEEVIWDLMEDSTEVDEETKRDIEQAKADIKAGRFYTFEEVKKKLSLKVKKSVAEAKAGKGKILRTEKEMDKYFKEL